MYLYVGNPCPDVSDVPCNGVEIPHQDIEGIGCEQTVVDQRVGIISRHVPHPQRHIWAPTHTQLKNKTTVFVNCIHLCIF